jgi:coenzyme F420-reducing hydrogenase alpha subunit
MTPTFIYGQTKHLQPETKKKKKQVFKETVDTGERTMEFFKKSEINGKRKQRNEERHIQRYTSDGIGTI